MHRKQNMIDPQNYSRSNSKSGNIYLGSILYFDHTNKCKLLFRGRVFYSAIQITKANKK